MDSEIENFKNRIDSAKNTIKICKERINLSTKICTCGMCQLREYVNNKNDFSILQFDIFVQKIHKYEVIDKHCRFYDELNIINQRREDITYMRDIIRSRKIT